MFKGVRIFLVKSFEIGCFVVFWIIMLIIWVLIEIYCYLVSGVVKELLIEVVKLFIFCFSVRMWFMWLMFELKFR